MTLHGRLSAIKKTTPAPSPRAPLYVSRNNTKGVPLEELRKKLSALEETRTIAQGELDALRSGQERIEQLQNDADTILNRYAGMVPEALDPLTSEGRPRVYKMLRLKVLFHADGSTEITGVFGVPVEADTSGSAKTGVSSRCVLMGGRS